VLKVWARTQENRAKVRLLRSYDPEAAPHEHDLVDPYYGEEEGFDVVLEQVRAAAPGLVAAVREELQQRGARDSA
jgi:protein-tyrosine phosphatase